MDRRSFLAFGAAGALSTLAAPPLLASTKKFAGITLRINGYGGIYDQALLDGVVAPLTDSTGLKVEFAPSSTSADIAKIIADPSNPHIDMMMVDSPYVPMALEGGILDEVTEADVPNLSRVFPGFREFGNYGVPFSVASIIPVYNSEEVDVPVTSFADLMREDLRDKVGLMPAGQHTGWLVALALAEGFGGSIDDLTPGYKALAENAANVVTTPPSSVAQVQAFIDGEVAAGALWDGRTHEARKNGTPLVTVVAKEGIYSVTTYIQAVKNGKNREAVHAFMNALLADEGMLAIPKVLRYGPTTPVDLGEIAPEVLLNSPERSAMKRQIDWVKLMKKGPEISEELNKLLRM